MTTGKVVDKVTSNLDFFLPFRQHGPSLQNARREIYADIGRLACEDGIGLFNILAFRGVFFGSPFARSERFQWFQSLDDWKEFRATEREEALKASNIEEKYYVDKGCYGRSQKDRTLELLPKYWNQRQSWNDIFDRSTTPTVKEVYNWLMSREKGRSKFHNIGSLTALLICGDLAEAGIIPMPSSYELGQVIYLVGKGAKDGMIKIGLVSNEANQEEFCNAFSSLDAYLESKLGAEEKEAMGYNVVMLEHTLCKIKRLTTSKLTLDNIFAEI
jgi:hypothetical protein